MIITEVYIGLGSNLAEPKEQLRQARINIAKQEFITEVAFSSLYKSSPMGPKDQPDYINAVMEVSTQLTALDLLRVLQKIEIEQGRVRKGERWGARTLDLDLLLYGGKQIEETDLIVPHPGVSERAFVLYPLDEIARDDLVVPGQGVVKQLLMKCPKNGLEKTV